jgi:hypothetical protein
MLFWIAVALYSPCPLVAVHVYRHRNDRAEAGHVASIIMLAGVIWWAVATTAFVLVLAFGDRT